MRAQNHQPCRCSRYLLSVLLLLLAFVPSKQQSGAAPRMKHALISSAAQFVVALKDAQTETIILQADIFLDHEQKGLQPTHTPTILGINQTLTIAGVGTRRTLDVGGTLQLLYLEAGSHLHLDNLTLQGLSLPSSGYQAGLTIEVLGSPYWPSIDGADGHQVTFTNGAVSYHTAGCTPSLVHYQAEKIKEQVGANGTVTELTGGLAIDVLGSIHLHPHISDRVTREHLGEATLSYTNFTITCAEDSGAAPPSGSSIGSQGGSKADRAWIWALAATLAGLTVAVFVAAGVLLLRRRRRRRRQLEAGLDIAGLAGCESGSLGLSSSSGSKPSASPLVGGALPRQALEATVGGEGSNLGAGPVGEAWLEDVNRLGSAMWHSRVGVIEGLVLGELLGRGSFGRCYRGRWKGAVVACKIIEQRVLPGKECDLSREPLLSLSLSHPNCIMTYKISVVRLSAAPAPSREDSANAEILVGSEKLQPVADGAGANSCQPPPQQQLAERGSCSAGSSSGARAQESTITSSSGSRKAAGAPRAVAQRQRVPALRTMSGGQAGMVEVVSPQEVLTPGLYETWLLMEYADRGSLTNAILAGRFTSPVTHELDLVAVLLTLLDIAQGLAYLHGENLVHADLKTRNCLLKTARNDRRQFVAKLADFGLSRTLLGDTHLLTSTFGTITHAAPELLAHGTLTKAADIYALGIIMWEMVAGQEVYEDMTPLQIIMQVSQHDHRPELPASCPSPLAALAQRCWHADPALRPSVEEVVLELRLMLREARRPLVGRAASEPVQTTSALT